MTAPAALVDLWKALPDADPSSIDYLRRRGLDAAPRLGLVKFSTGKSGHPWLDARASEGYRLAFPVRNGAGELVGFLLRHIGHAGGKPDLLSPETPKHGVALAHPNRCATAATVFLAADALDVLALQIAEVPVVGTWAPDLVRGLGVFLGNVTARAVVACVALDPVPPPPPDLLTNARAFGQLLKDLDAKGARTRTVTPKGEARSIAGTAATLGRESFRAVLAGAPPPPPAPAKGLRSAPAPAPAPSGGSAPAPAVNPADLVAPDVEPGAVLQPVNDPHRARPLTKSYASICQILRTPSLRAAVLEDAPLEFNEQTMTPTVGRRAIEPVDVARIRERAEIRFSSPKRAKGLQFNRGDIEEAIAQVSREHPFHPVAEFLGALKWDGVERLSHLAADVLQIGPGELALSTILLRRFMIAAVARALKPGCKVDTVLILTGSQGARKSTFLRILAGDEWFSDTAIDIHSKDAFMVLRRVWILEWAELAAMTRARDGEAVKGFVSSQADTFRPPYEREVRNVPRSNVIVGTTNSAQFLNDETGERRWWPVPVSETIDFALLASLREQLWAEAVAAFRKGEQWHLTPDEETLLRAAQVRYKARDAWEDLVLPFVESCSLPPTLADVLKDGVNKPAGQWTPHDERRVTRILREAQFENRQLQIAGRRAWRWIKKGDPRFPVGVTSYAPPQREPEQREF
jgi:hypothetical protein